MIRGQHIKICIIYLFIVTIPNSADNNYVLNSLHLGSKYSALVCTRGEDSVLFIENLYYGVVFPVVREDHFFNIKQYFCKSNSNWYHFED